MKKLSTTKKRIIAGVALLAIVIAAGTYFWWPQQDKVSGAVAFNCIYPTGTDYARCLPKVENVGCYGYYDLKTGDIKDGIDPVTTRGSTCEGFIHGTGYDFDKDGNYIKSYEF